ncbi:hypothetical protein NXT08_22365 [Rhodococcus pyridinivorans]|uniref:hypothetical protein n=1 Tax=Rhodococcus pyridinivorans TaxID=103816 RepID=UPI0021641EA7|nr:hypothetical protein [Rhodococcus pyridinivorans]UVT24948.1 hypothetical protein NXT08_22365 [Rhodococcus pyridinivorans]
MSTVDDADAWWHAQTAERRITIYGWLCRSQAPGTHPVDGQLAMPFPIDTERKGNTQ